MISNYIKYCFGVHKCIEYGKRYAIESINWFENVSKLECVWMKNDEINFRWK